MIANFGKTAATLAKAADGLTDMPLVLARIARVLGDIRQVVIQSAGNLAKTLEVLRYIRQVLIQSAGNLTKTPEVLGQICQILAKTCQI